MNGYALTAVFAVVGSHVRDSENPYQGKLTGDTESLRQKVRAYLQKYQDNLNL